MWELDGKRLGGGAVCRNVYHNHWGNDSSTNECMRQVLLDAGRPMYHLKKAQTLWIAQTTRAGFPPDVVAFWNDHSLSMAERHDMLGDAYLPDREPRGYGRFAPRSARRGGTTCS